MSARQAINAATVAFFMRSHASEHFYGCHFFNIVTATFGDLNMRRVTPLGY